MLSFNPPKEVYVEEEPQQVSVLMYMEDDERVRIVEWERGETGILLPSL